MAIWAQSFNMRPTQVYLEDYDAVYALTESLEPGLYAVFATVSVAARPYGIDHAAGIQLKLGAAEDTGMVSLAIDVPPPFEGVSRPPPIGFSRGGNASLMVVSDTTHGESILRVVLRGKNAIVTKINVTVVSIDEIREPIYFDVVYGSAWTTFPDQTSRSLQPFDPAGAERKSR